MKPSYLPSNNPIGSTGDVMSLYDVGIGMPPAGGSGRYLFRILAGKLFYVLPDLLGELLNSTFDFCRVAGSNQREGFFIEPRIGLQQVIG